MGNETNKINELMAVNAPILCGENLAGWVGLVPLTRGKFAMVDGVDLDRVLAHRWYATPNRFGYAWYAKGRQGSMARFILGLPKGTWIDHRNGDTLDNRRSNLRPATAKQNAQNQAKKRYNRRGGLPASQYKGIHLDRSTGLWRAQIRNADGKQISLGSHLYQEHAAMAYDAAARRIHGEFARVNFPEVA